MSDRRPIRWFVAALLVSGWVGCARSATIAGPSPSNLDAGRLSRMASGSHVLRLEPDPGGTLAAPFGADPRWRSASDGGELELERLARAEGARGLTTAVTAGGSAALVALRALPFCPDAEATIGALCEWVAAARPAQPLLDAIARVAARPYGFGELLDAEGLDTCERDLAKIEPGWSSHERDLAASARAMLAEWRRTR